MIIAYKGVSNMEQVKTLQDTELESILNEVAEEILQSEIENSDCFGNGCSIGYIK